MDLVIWRDIWFAATFERRHSHACEWKAFSIFGQDDAPDGEVLFQYDADDGRRDGTPDIAHATPVAEGFAKWDGCSEFTVAEPFHGCTAEHVDNFAEMLRRTFREAVKRIPAADEGLTGVEKGETPRGRSPGAEGSN